jgi:hypothetical protein
MVEAGVAAPERAAGVEEMESEGLLVWGWSVELMEKERTLERRHGDCVGKMGVCFVLSRFGVEVVSLLQMRFDV